MNADKILELLALRHAKDVWVPECKDGSTWMGKHRRLDGWAMARSWAHPRMVGYEIKVERGDFLGDDKWQDYLCLCHELYFVAPKGLIQAEELPERVGLLEVSSNCKMLRLKRKAAHREIQPPTGLMAYVLMARSKIVPPNYYEIDNREYWRNWLAQKESDWKLGYQVGSKLRERWARLEADNMRLTRSVENCEEVRKILKDLGFSTEYSIWESQIKQAIEEKRTGISQRLSYLVNQLFEDVGRIKKLVDETKVAK